MSVLRSHRVARGLTQADLAEACRISRQLVGRLESGQSLPNSDLARKLESVLQCGPLTCTADEVTTKGWPLQSYEFPAVDPECWRRALKDWAYQIQRLGISPALLSWLKHYLACESAIEAYTFLQLARFAARPQVSNPHLLGFRALPIVDRVGKLLGGTAPVRAPGPIRGRPVLTLDPGPPEPANYAYRPDALVLLRRGGRLVWCILEVDGKGHDPERDAFRQSMIKLDEIRLTDRMVRNHQASESFKRQALDLLAKRMVTSK